MKSKWNWALVALILLVVVSPLTVYAADSDIVISEVMFNTVCGGANATDTNCAGGTTETQFEWVEIYNKGTSSVDIQNWQICDSAGCDTITTSSTLIGPGEYWLIGNFSTGLQAELTGETKTYDASHTFLLSTTNNPIGNNGLANSSDVVYLKTGSSGNVTDCISWSLSNACAGLTYVSGGGGFDSTLSNEQNGQSIQNIGGTWGYHGPVANTSNQGSPYAANTNTAGVTAITLRTLTAAAPLSPLAAALPALGLVAAGGIVAWRRRRG